MKKILFALVAMAGLSTTGCAMLGPFGLIFTDVTMPHGFESLQKADTTNAPEAHGSACNTVILGLVAFGNGGADAAYKNALASAGVSSLWDVRVDTSYTSILGIYSSYCTQLTGKVSR